MNTIIFRILILYVALLAAMPVSAGAMSFDPYVPGEGKAALATELGLAADELLVDRRCVYSKTAQWVAQAPVKSFSTCTLVLTPTRLILSIYDAGQKTHSIEFSFEYPQIKNVALSVVDDGNDSMHADGKKIQFQFETDQGFFSVSATRSGPRAKPADWRGGTDAFELMKEKGVPVTESKGRVDMENPKLIYIRR